MSIFDGNGKRESNGDGSGNGSGNGASPDGEKRKEREDIPAAGQRTAVNAGTRFGVGMPVEKSENFVAAAKRLLVRMQRERLRILLVLVLAVISVTLTVIGPRILGHATNVVVDGISSGRGIDFGQ